MERTKLNQRMNELRAGVAGAAGLIDRSFRPRDSTRVMAVWLAEIGRQLRFEERPSEAQRGIIAERLLGPSKAIEVLQLMVNLAAQSSAVAGRAL